MNASAPKSQGRSATAERSDDSRYLIFGRVAEQIDASLRAGRPPDVEALVADHPEMAEEIRQLVSAQVLLYELGHAPGDPDSAGADVLGQLGDFRIQGQIGRGGMGVVYEAQQISLRRRVALKVLPFAAILDPKHLQRFKNEAQAAVSLKHPNVVGIHSVGCARGVHYYAMEYVEGQTLAEVVHQGLGARDEGIGDCPPPSTHGSRIRRQVSARLVVTAFMRSRPAPMNRGTTNTPSTPPIHPVTSSPRHPVTSSPLTPRPSPLSPHTTDTSPLALLSTEGSTRTPEFFRSWFFLSMAHLRLDNPQEARRSYDEAVRRGQKGDDVPAYRRDTLVRFRREAAELLEINDEAASDERKATSKQPE